MTAPPVYTPAHSFLSDVANLPSFPGQNIDVEFNALATTFAAYHTNLALIQRADGALANGVVTYDSLASSLQTAGLAPMTAWATATLYAVNAIVAQGSSFYKCSIAHTSGTFATDLAAGDWTLISTLPTAGSASANTLLAGPTTGSPAQSAFRLLVGADLPNPAAGTLGGVRSLAVVTSKWINTISTSGVPAATQPAFTDISGSVAAGQMPALTGDVTTSAGAVATTIAAAAVTYAKIQNVSATSRILGRTTAGAGSIEELTGAQAATIAGAALAAGGQTLTGGFSGTSVDLGTITTGTVTPAAASGNIQHYTNNGAHTLAPPATVTSITIEILNAGSAGAITTSGYTKVTGDSLTTVNTSKFKAYINVGHAYSHLHITALQ